MALAESGLGEQSRTDVRGNLAGTRGLMGEEDIFRVSAAIFSGKQVPERK
jgi:hypothetical protein